jgi:hypothetical protein
MKCKGKNCKGCRYCEHKKGGDKKGTEQEARAMVAAKMAEKMRGGGGY